MQTQNFHQKNSIIKSKNDKNIYFTNTLPNKLKYLLINDPECDRSACSLDIKIGSSSHSNEIEGLAHSLEHCLFLGTEKYPEKDEFDDFLTKNSGESNAYTTVENTNFHYDISNEGLEKSLDMFSQFFINPLFTKNLIYKELESIDSEYKMDLRDDDERISHLKIIEGYQHSEYNRFICGCLETLKIENIREKIIEFYNEFYIPENMSLTVISNLSIEKLNSIIIDKFSLIKNKKKEDNNNNNNNNKTNKKNYLYDENNMGFIYKIIPVKNKNKLEIFWVINENYVQYYLYQPFEYIVSILGHEGKNSLTSYLKKKEYIFDLITSYNDVDCSFTEFSISVDLTEKGFENIKETINIILSYLNLIQHLAINKNFFNEIQKSNEIEFDFYEKDDPLELVINLSENLNNYPSNLVIYLNYIIEKYDPDLIQKTLNNLTLKNMNIYLISQKFEKDLNLNFQTEKWMNIKYYKEKIPNEYLNIINYEKIQNEYKLGYPPENIFIPKNFDLINLNNLSTNIKEEYKYPKKIEDNKHIVWYKPDFIFKIPKIYINGKIYFSNLNMDNCLFSIYSNLCLYIILKELNEDLYLGDLSKNNLKFEFSFSSFYINLDGYSDTLETFTKTIFQKIKNILQFDKIENIKNKLISKIELSIKNCKNENLENISTKSQKNLMKILVDPKNDNKIKLSIYNYLLNNLKENGKIIENLIIFFKNLFLKTKFEWLIQGNIDPKKGLNFINYLEKEIKSWSSSTETKNLTINEIRKKRIAKIEKNNFLEEIIENSDFEDKNNCLLSYFQIGKIDLHLNEDLKKLCLLKLIEQIFYEDFYDELRTEQQIGYDVSLIIFSLFKIYGINCYIQSTKFSPKEIQDKINKFFVDFSLNDDEKFSVEDFESYKISVINILKEKDLNLGEEFEKNFKEISEREYLFDKNEKMIKCLENEIKKEDVVNFFKEFIYETSQRIDVGIYSKNINEINNNVKMEIDDDDENLPSFVNSNKINVNNIIFFDEMFF